MNQQRDRRHPVLRLLAAAAAVPVLAVLGGCGSSGEGAAPMGGFAAAAADAPAPAGGGSCSGDYRDTDYIPSKSDAVFEQDGVRVAIHQVPSKALTIEVTSNDGRFDETQLDPGEPLYDGLEVFTSMGYGWDFNYETLDYELDPGVITSVLRVYDCWTYVTGPDIF